jgi:CHAT domain-containing protein
LENKYPAYYRYKYEDAVPSFNDLQNHLAQNKESFIHYFINDTVAYILPIHSEGSKLYKLTRPSFSAEKLTRFIEFCSDKNALNRGYRDFASLSNSLYKILFQPFQVPKGRVIICPDNYLIPFEALCVDAEGRDFLIKNYAFSYVYSATYLLKNFNSYESKGNFIGFAPVSFNSALGVPSLNNSAVAVRQSANNYSDNRLFISSAATRNNFINQMGLYTIVNVFSHARADSTDNEPVLFMQDSMIHLSELQLLNRPATKLVVLSACQTNVGKSATGEGVYSLARGFASAGVPSISATLWKADEHTIYTISERLHYYLSTGMRKDEALQKAKLDFIRSNRGEKNLPYYWANMILIGKPTPIALSAVSYHWWFVGVGIVTLILIIAIFLIKRRYKPI